MRSRTYLSLFAALAVNIFVANLALAEVAIGSIPGSFDVTLSGSASYSVPIKIAPGAAGTEPRIQLVYDSQAIGGAMGPGWSLSGLSVITRGPKDQFTDGTIAGVHLDESDALYLDGQRLVPISQSGAGGSRKIEYRKAFDDQTKIVQTGADFGSSVFWVQTKGGILITFDGSNNSRVHFSDKTLAMAESFVFDTVGNYIQFEYRPDNNGDYNITSIKYTGLGTANPAGGVNVRRAPFASVTFEYDPAPPLTSYIAGRLLVRDVRLKSIQSVVADRPSMPASRYELEYKDRSNADRFVLSTLHQFGDDGQELSPTRFTYSEPTIAWKKVDYSFPSSAVLAGRERLGAAYRFAHFAPTGTRPDLLFAAQIAGKLEAFAFRNDGPTAPNFWAPLPGFKPPVPFMTAEGADLGVIVADVDGDGRVDLLQSYSINGQKTTISYLAKVDSFELHDEYKLPFVVSRDGRVVAQYRFANWWHGPGPDLLYQSDTESGFLRNTATGWEPDPLHAPPRDLVIDARLHVIDIDCSGAPTLLGVGPKPGGGLEWKVYRFDAARGWVVDCH
ncbi:SpvB/TcaC N-terminal domain-containing protein [Rhodoblastus sp.]|jgi:hypothetical protein|uniref:SpvB/TcaC N-terminal domain-containing protein n=1 Tax=Rhodoblastus sp. TaxID=1962975 RepID=UPI0025FA8F46|nr:SpvB/TcaC N-terminal domain-containing protein [Rhodoblastus sp.]